MDWKVMPEFSEIDLSESFVLGWSISSDSVEFQIEAVLCKNHPKYHEPKPNEWACYHRGKLYFRGVQSLNGLPNQSKVRNSIDAAGEHDFGHIDTLSRIGDKFKMSGDFGEISFTAKEVCLALGPA